MGIADRTDFDLKQHIEHSGKALDYFDSETGERYVARMSLSRPSALTALRSHSSATPMTKRLWMRRRTTSVPSCGFTRRLRLTKRYVLPRFPKNFLRRAGNLRRIGKDFMIDYDEAGSIGKRYRRQDEIGTPYCITVDFETEADGCVTVRDRDSMAQDRIPVSELKEYISSELYFKGENLRSV